MKMSWHMRRCRCITSPPVGNAPSLWLAPQTADTMSCVGGSCLFSQKNLPLLFHVSTRAISVDSNIGYFHASVHFRCPCTEMWNCVCIPCRHNQNRKDTWAERLWVPLCESDCFWKRLGERKVHRVWRIWEELIRHQHRLCSRCC